MSGDNTAQTGKYAVPNPSHQQFMLLSLLRWSDTISGIILLIIMLDLLWPIATTSPHNHPWPLLLICPILVACYILYTVLANEIVELAHIGNVATRDHHEWRLLLYNALIVINRSRRALHNRKGDPGNQGGVFGISPAIVRSARAIGFIMLTVGFMVAFMIIIRREYLAIHLPIDQGAIWLLYVLPIQRIARAGSISWLVTVCATTAFAIFTFSRVFDFPLLFDSHSVLLLKALWLILIALVPSLLTIYLADREARFRRMRRLIDELAGIHLSLDGGLANAIATKIAHALGYTYVNIFVIKASPTSRTIEGARLIGAANAAGQRLVEKGYALDDLTGIVGSAIRQRRAVHVNDIARDRRRRFIAHKAFPGTQSEAAIPIMMGASVLGVLDLQSATTYAFNADDINLLGALTTHLAVVFSAAENFLRVKGLYGVSQTATQRVVTTKAVGDSVQTILEQVRLVLQSDSVVLYARNPHNGSLIGPYTAGIPNTEASPAHIVQANPHSRVHEFMNMRDIDFLQHPSGDSHPEEQPSGPRGRSFVNQTKIHSAVVIPILASEQNATSQLGVIFVNYRVARPRNTFTDADIEWCESMAEITSLVLQHALLLEQVFHIERMNIGREIHDSLGSYASLIRLLLEDCVALFTLPHSLTELDLEKLTQARDLSQLLQHDVNGLLKLTSSSSKAQHLFSRIQTYSEIRGRVRITCIPTFSGDDDALPPDLQHDAERIILEAIRNADRHGDATEIRLGLRCHGNALYIRIADNGRGFDPNALKRTSGLDNMAYRARKWGGMVYINRKPRSCPGATIFAHLPFERVNPTYRAL